MLTHDLRIIDQQNWTDLVSPRSKLRMSIVTREVAFPDIIDRSECVMPTSYVFSPSYSIYTPLTGNAGCAKDQMKTNATSSK